MRQIGIDIGSLTLSSVLLEDGKIVVSSSVPHRGRVRHLLEPLVAEYTAHGFDSIGVAGGRLAGKEGVLDPALAVIEGMRLLVPGTQNALSVGGEHFLLAFFDPEGRYREHVENPPCASGTGSFIEQQAERLGMSAEEFAKSAGDYTGKVPDIATRCAVFAKSDIIHAMQEGFSVPAIAAGVCLGIARNLLDTLLKGRTLVAPLAVVGGVAHNRRITEALAKLSGTRVLVTEHAALAGAAGAALLGRGKTIDVAALFDGDHSRSALRPRLSLSLSNYPDFSRYEISLENEVEIFQGKNGGSPTSAQDGCALGFDVGSTSTKAVVVDLRGDIVRGFYTRTKGDPVRAVQTLTAVMKKSFGGGLPRVVAAGTTGSGRKMIKELFLADLAVNEITAHALAAKRLYPEVDTIIEIGGQDSKLTILSNGEVSYAQMNYVCAAGTGSFIDEQAKRLGLTLDEISDSALRGEAPFTSDRCTVYMERDLAVFSGKGWSTEALAAAVLFSVRDNYLSKVVQRTPLGKAIVFQGATARNRALVAAFEEALGKPIHVSPYCHLTGAYGAALSALADGRESSDFLALEDGITFSEETCALCANRCALLVARAGGRKSGWGMKCGREYEERKPAGKEKDPAVLARFEESGRSLSLRPAVSPRNAVTIALLDGLYNREYNPLWHSFLSLLGFTVSTVTPSREGFQKGKESVNSDFCAPMIMAHGLARAAAAGDANWIFFPALVNERDPEIAPARFREKIRDACFCYYSQYFPTVQKFLTARGAGEKLISPLISFNPVREDDVVDALHQELEARFPEIGREAIAEAFREASRLFAKARQTYRKNLPPPSGTKIRVVLLGRPYVVFDRTLSLSIPARLEEAGVEVYWQDEIDLEGLAPVHAEKYLDRMHWKYGREILRALEYCAVTPNTFPVYLSCFRCSPDSFLLSYAKAMMLEAGKPFLFLGLDELASPVGYTTRIEAALHAFANHVKGRSVRPRGKVREENDGALAPGDTVLIPYLNRLISRFWAECFNNAGYRGEVLETGAAALATGYAYAHGGECMPAAAIVGGMIEKVKEKGLDPATTMLYIPTLCMACNFPQFPILARNAAAAAGYPTLKVALINSMLQGEHLPGNLSMKIFEAGVLGSLIYKLYFHLRPYEKTAGSADRALDEAEQLLAMAFREGRDTRVALEKAAAGFRSIERDTSCDPKPRIAILGDFYVKYNQTVNRNLQELIMAEGGELVIPSFTEMTFHYFDVDVRLYGENNRHLKVLRMFEGRYEKIVADLIPGLEEPDWNDCVEALTSHGVSHYIPGETSITAARALYYLSRKAVDAIVHINPMFCCPGVVSASLFKKISSDFAVPIIDIFYDGTGEPNRVLTPHLHYLRARRPK